MPSKAPPIRRIAHHSEPPEPGVALDPTVENTANPVILDWLAANERGLDIPIRLAKTRDSNHSYFPTMESKGSCFRRSAMLESPAEYPMEGSEKILP